MSAVKGKIGIAFMTTSGRQSILNWVSDLAVSSSGVELGIKGCVKREATYLCAEI